MKMLGQQPQKRAPVPAYQPKVDRPVADRQMGRLMDLQPPANPQYRGD